MAKTKDTFVFTAEIDHENNARNQYDHMEGIFHKKVLPRSVRNGVSAPTVRHANELFDAVSQAFSTGLRCRLMLVKGTRYAIAKAQIRAAVDGDYWVVKELSGNVSDGFEFVLIRVE